MKSDSTNNPAKNYAYIDSQNLNMTIQNLGWNVDWAKFREYLRSAHGVVVAYLFIGYIAENQELYSFLQKAGFVIIFKPVVIGKEGNVKGNIDAELVLQVMIDQTQYDKAVIVTGDGDFHGLVNYLYSQNKLECLLVPNMRQYSSLLKGAARDRIDFISNMRRELEYKKRPQSRTNGATTTSAEQRPAGRRGPQAKLEDALIKAVDEGQKAPITAEEPGDKISQTPPSASSAPRAVVTKTGNGRSYRPAPKPPSEPDK